MAPKSAPKSLTIPENTNFLAIASDYEANPRYKCFTQFIVESYLKKALFIRPTLYLDVLENFWNAATVEEIALESSESRQVIICNIKSIAMRIAEEDFNQTFKIPEEVVAPSTYEELMDFMDLIHYLSEIDLARLNKKFVRKEWRTLYDTMLKVFV